MDSLAVLNVKEQRWLTNVKHFQLPNKECIIRHLTPYNLHLFTLRINRYGKYERSKELVLRQIKIKR